MPPVNRDNPNRKKSRRDQGAGVNKFAADRGTLPCFLQENCYSIFMEACGSYRTIWGKCSGIAYMHFSIRALGFIFATQKWDDPL